MGIRMIVPIMSAADHGAWLGSGVFDGARYFDGVAPDLLAHCTRVNASAEALMLTPTVTPEQMVEIYMSNPQVVQQIEPVVLEQRAVDWLVENGKVKEKKVSFTEYMDSIS